LISDGVRFIRSALVGILIDQTDGGKVKFHNLAPYLSSIKLHM